MINILQVGLGPLGIKIYQYIQDKSSLQTIAALDINPDLLHRDLSVLSGHEASGLMIQNSMNDIDVLDKIDIAIVTTTSSLEKIESQISEIIDYGIPVISTCEELTFPWSTFPEISQRLDNLAQAKGVAILSTGVNPGFLMDTLPSLLSGVCKEVNHVTVHRFQDARTRRIPFQKKIGAGLSLDAFESKKQDGSLRHVGLTESMHFIADAMGWTIDHTEDVISPVIADHDIETEALTISKGHAMGVRQEGRASFNGQEKIKLIFEAAVGSGRSFDEVIISGQPNIHSKIDGGVHGDIATCSIVLNAIPTVLKAAPGLRTMKDVGIVSCVR